MTSRTILDLDLRKILSKIEKAYGIKLPRSVLAVDYGERTARRANRGRTPNLLLR